MSKISAWVFDKMVEGRGSEHGQAGIDGRDQPEAEGAESCKSEQVDKGITGCWTLTRRVRASIEEQSRCWPLM